MGYDAVRSRDEDFVPLRLIERSTAFSSRYAMTIIAMPTSQRSTCRMKGLLGIVFVAALFIIRVLSIEGLRSATNTLLGFWQLTLPYSGRNIHHRLKLRESVADFFELRHFSDFWIPNSCGAMVPKAGPMIGIYSRLHAVVKMTPPVVQCRD
jgi:hypothetical protein